MAVLLAATACGKQDEPEPVPAADAPTDEMFVAGDVTLTRGELEQASAYIREYLPGAGRKARWRLVFEDLVQTRLFRQDYGDQMPALRERAAALSEATQRGGYPELMRQGEAFGGYQEELPYARSSLPWGVSEFVFDPDNLGRVSPPIEVPQGYLVASCGLLEPGTTTDQDRAHVFLVPFVALRAQAFNDWWEAQKGQLSANVTHIHPDMEGVLPPWLRDR